MNIFTHEQYWHDQIRRARRLQWLGLGAVLLSAVFSFGTVFNPDLVYLVLLAYPLMFLGFPVWTMSRGTQRRLKLMPRADHLLNHELKSLNNKYSLHHYASYQGTLIHHLLVTPSGLIVMMSSYSAGPVYCKDDKWQSRSGFFDRISGLRPPVGNPTQELNASVEAARKLLADIGKPQVPVKGVVLFTQEPELEIEGCTYSAAPMSEVKQAVKDIQLAMDEQREGSVQLDVILTSEDRRRVNYALTPDVPAPAKSAPARR